MSKYHAVKTNGYSSKKEAARAAQLKVLERIGDISDLKEQVKFELLPTQKRADGSKERKVEYVADFTYQVDGECIVEDTKGFPTDVWIIKRKLMLFIHGITVLES